MHTVPLGETISQLLDSFAFGRHGPFACHACTRDGHSNHTHRFSRCTPICKQGMQGDERTTYITEPVPSRRLRTMNIYRRGMRNEGVFSDVPGSMRDFCLP